MKTIFLAAGQSSRTEPISNKNFLEFCGEPLFIKLLKNAKKGGLSDFILVAQESNATKYKKLLNHFKFTAEVVIQKRLEEGQAGGVKIGLKKVPDNEPVFVLGGNDLIAPETYKNIIKQSKGIDGAILAKKIKQYFPGGYLQIDNKKKISRIIEKPGKGNEPSDLINIVAHFFTRAKDFKTALREAKSKNDDVYEIALQNLFREKNFIAVEYRDIWKTIKYSWHILDMMDFYLNTQKNYISNTAKIAKNATLKGENIIISDNVKIYENSTIQGPCFIGKNSIIGNNALIRNSMIGSKCTIGFNTEIARSYLAGNITTHFAYIGDSIIDENVNFGAFSCTANLRLDKKNIRVEIRKEKLDSKRRKLGAIVGKGSQIGVHAKLMPGIKLKKDSLVLPGEVMK